MNNRSVKQSINFQAYLRRHLKNPVVRQHYDHAGKQLEIAYQIARLRRQYGISQSELAQKLGMTQSNVARIEAGQQNFTTETLQKIAHAFKRDLRIEFV